MDLWFWSYNNTIDFENELADPFALIVDRFPYL